MFKNQIQLKKITFLIGFALVNEMGGNFSLNFEFDFSLVFWVRSREKHVCYKQ